MPIDKQCLPVVPQKLEVSFTPEAAIGHMLAETQPGAMTQGFPGKSLSLLDYIVKVELVGQIAGNCRCQSTAGAMITVFESGPVIVDDVLMTGIELVDDALGFGVSSCQ